MAVPEMHRISDIIANFRPTRQFKAPPSTTYTSLDFDDSGEFLLLSRTDDTIQLFNVKAGGHAKELKSQKYGSALARFTHHSTSIVYASTKVDHGIRYLSMHDNSFIRYFKGHTDRVTSLAMSPGGDQFLSASLDNTVRLWDCRSQNPSGQLNFTSPYHVAYDPSATVVAIASPPAQALLLYDIKNYDKPPFATFDMEAAETRAASTLGQRPAQGWTGIEFSNNGKYILVATNGPAHYILDAYSGDILHYLSRPSGPSGRAAPGQPIDDVAQPPLVTQSDAAFSPDGRYVVGGNGAQPGLLVWDLMGEGPAGARPDKILQPVTDLPHNKAAAVVAYNPRHNFLASADKELTMWIPDPDLS